MSRSSVIRNLKEQIKNLEDKYRDEIKSLDDQYKDAKDKQRDFYRKKMSELNSTIQKLCDKILYNSKESQSEGNEELEELRMIIASKDKEIEELNFTVESCLNTINELKKLDDEKED